MRHRNGNKKMGVKSAHRIALLRNLVRNLVIHKRIQTTVLKAKEASSYSDRMIELAKKGTLHSRRLLISRVGCAETADTLIREIAPQFKDRQGGYTRVLKLGNRPGDGAQKAILEFTVPFETLADRRAKAEEAEKKAKKKKGKTAKSKEAEAPEPKETAKKKAKSSKKTEKPEVEAPDDKKETDKKGGFLGTLRKFLKGDE